jgi:hypothetical protein
MDDYDGRPRRRLLTGKAGAAGLLVTGAVAGSVLAATLSASAAGSSPSPTPTTPAYGTVMPGAPGPHGPDARMGGAAPVRGDEHALSASNADKVRAAALKAAPGGTVYRVETDAGDGVYEAHMTKSDGTPVTVKLDKNFNVTKVEDGMGTGDPRPAGAPNAQQPSGGASA